MTAQYNKLRCIATLEHGGLSGASGGGHSGGAVLTSWIEFDRDSEFIAAAGRPRTIDIYEFSSSLGDTAAGRHPVKEMTTRAKPSGLSWNVSNRDRLLSADYDGNVTLWDIEGGLSLNEYKEHEKRAWSVDFSRLSPTSFASGGDDGRVIVWSTKQATSVMTIDTGGNVCSVKFDPSSPEKLAFGSLDQCVHYYDLRNPERALHVFKQHRRTVSYVNFLSSGELVSMGVDSTIKLWDLDTYQLAETFRGHCNDRHFVGLDVNPDYGYFLCGSEDNIVYVYHRAVPTPLIMFDLGDSAGNTTKDDSYMPFISAVCWCPKIPTICLGANSKGVIKVLELHS